MQSIADQLAHIIAGFAVAMLVLWIPWPSPSVQGALLGFSLGVTREVTQMQGSDPVDYRFGANRLLDVLFWTFGGFAAGVLSSPTLCQGI